jgi:hypothetical protein
MVTALKLDQMLSTSGLRREQLHPRFGAPELVRKDTFDFAKFAQGSVAGESALEEASARRTRLWEFDGHLHCSIVGTCLTTAEIRHVVTKLKVETTGDGTEHELHTLGVMLASRQSEGAKFLNKTLDRKHHVTITRYGKARTPEAVLTLWEESLKQGDIPGAYWAVLTHPATTEDVIKRAFGDVHMLSHLVGAANRADIRRLRQLEQDNAALTAKIERQQRQLQEGFVERDQSIARLSNALAQQASNQAASNDSDDKAVAQSLELRLGQEIARRERIEQRAAELANTLTEKNRALAAAQHERDAACHELELLETHLSTLTHSEVADVQDLPNLSGRTLLYVGGRANQIPQLKSLAERTGAHFIHHDGGIEQSAAVLSGFISRADHVLFPIDCISHDAMATIKRLCRSTGKHYEPLRTASLTGLLSALARMSAASQQVAAE